LKPNIVDPGMTHRRQDIAARNSEMDRYCAAILPQAQALVQDGVAQRTAQAASEVLVDEADAMLKSMLAELAGQMDARPDVVLEQLSREIAAGDLAEDDQQWIAQLAGDFALAASAFWLDLGDAGPDRPNRQQLVLKRPAKGQDEQLLAAFDLIAARCYVGREGRALLTTLNDVSQEIFIDKMSIDSGSILYVPDLTADYRDK
jgi:hypothetical protein